MRHNQLLTAMALAAVAQTPTPDRQMRITRLPEPTVTIRNPKRQHVKGRGGRPRNLSLKPLTRRIDAVGSPAHPSMNAQKRELIESARAYGFKGRSYKKAKQFERKMERAR